jgi:hypothetical protein
MDDPSRRKISIGEMINASSSNEALMRRVSGLGMEDPVINASSSNKAIMRRVSGLGMEDPVFGTRADEGRPDNPSAHIFDDMSIGDVPEDMRDLVSIASDQTAFRGAGLDQPIYETLSVTRSTTSHFAATVEQHQLQHNNRGKIKSVDSH